MAEVDQYEQGGGNCSPPAREAATLAATRLLRCSNTVANYKDVTQTNNITIDRDGISATVESYEAAGTCWKSWDAWLGNRAYCHDGERCTPITTMLETMDYRALTQNCLAARPAASGHPSTGRQGPSPGHGPRAEVGI